MKIALSLFYDGVCIAALLHIRNFYFIQEIRRNKKGNSYNLSTWFYYYSLLCHVCFALSYRFIKSFYKFKTSVLGSESASLTSIFSWYHYDLAILRIPKKHLFLILPIRCFLETFWNTKCNCPANENWRKLYYYHWNGNERNVSKIMRIVLAE